MNYNTLAKHVKLAIIRTQYGSNLIDRHYQTHHQQFKRRNIPTAAYAWVRGANALEMEKEATDFYNRTKQFLPTFWFLDVEEKSMPDMRFGVQIFLKKLRALGANKVGVYIAHHLYQNFNIDVAQFDAVWIPHYGKNNGTITSKPQFPCDLHQYTDRGKLPGYSGYLDLNRLTGTKPLEFFSENSKIKIKTVPPEKQPGQYEIIVAVGAFATANDAKQRINRRGTVRPGTYKIFNEYDGMINVTKQQGVPGSWINPKDNVRKQNNEREIE